MRVLSGIQPTGSVHLGNIAGALLHWVAAQERHDCLFAIVDLHALTTPREPAALRAATLDAAAALLALGVDPERATLFVQSHVPAHAELAWLLGCLTSLGELRRMTQFKDKGGEAAGAGLFVYPVLQAADVLLYRADRVPVGADQRQHLELARDLAQRFNRRYGETFVVPEAAIPPSGARIMDLRDPSAKMSKSRPPEGTIFLADEPDAIRRKVRAAVTDSGREVRAGPERPALSNLIAIFAAATGRIAAEIEAAYAGKGYAAFKGDLAEAVTEWLRPARERRVALLREPGAIEEALANGAARAREAAGGTLRVVYERVGLLAGR